MSGSRKLHEKVFAQFQGIAYDTEMGIAQMLCDDFIRMINNHEIKTGAVSKRCFKKAEISLRAKHDYLLKVLPRVILAFE